MLRILLASFCSIFWLGCSLAAASPRPAPVAAEEQSREELVAQANAMINSISARLSERGLAASVASENVAVLNQRAGKLRERCERLDARARHALAPHLQWLEELNTTTTLSIGVLRNETRDFEEDKAEVLLWTRTFKKEIEALERRIDRVAPINIYLTQRSRK